jgi:hypothetical protein
MIKSPKSWRLAGLMITVFMSLGLLYAVLLIPDSPPPLPVTAGHTPFVWNQDAYWEALETEFVANRRLGCENLRSSIAGATKQLDSLVTKLAADSHEPGSSLYVAIERTMFELGPELAACPDELTDRLTLYTRLRTEVKRQSRTWDMNAVEARGQMYRLLYGSRAVLEEVILQGAAKPFPALIPATDEPSATPSTIILGVTVHSGDILVSRGGAPTSALIARGSDYPGNFSHVALVHVDDSTRQASIIEAHIEIGVAVASLEQYLRDKKLRVMVLRLRSDLPEMASDPMLPHKAATAAITRARFEHIAYDFAMNYRDDARLFCSEVASSVYRQFGITLWMGISSISSPGVASWLSAFGVRHFETQEPSDLEYDPQLAVVAEWRDPETLWQDHLDNAIIDALLEGAERGDRLTYDWYMLPLGRLAKAYSVVRNRFGQAGPVPEGMSASAALRNDSFSKRHARIKARLLVLVKAFQDTNGYRPPYWTLLALARQAAEGN